MHTSSYKSISILIKPFIFWNYFNTYTESSSGARSKFWSTSSGADPEFLERGFTSIKVCGFTLLVLSHFF